MMMVTAFKDEIKPLIEDYYEEEIEDKAQILRFCEL